MQSSHSSTIADQTLPVTVIVPCYNEAESLPFLLPQLESLTQQLAGQYQIGYLFVDDGSRDATWDHLQLLRQQLPRTQLIRHEQNRGLAAALQTGLQNSTTEIVASIDADGTYRPEQLANLLPLLTADVDLVVASPYHELGQVVGVSKQRLWISQLASACYRWVMRHQLRTYTSCFRVYRRSTISQITLENAGFVGIPELLWKVELRGGRIVESPATLTVRTAGQSKLRIVRVTLAHLCLLSRIAWQRCFGTPTQSPCKATSTTSVTTTSFTKSAQEIAEPTLTTPHEHHHDCAAATTSV